jgi:hypothetical protein
MPTQELNSDGHGIRVFFEKKKQKTFAKLGFGQSGQAEAKMIKSFLLPAGGGRLFFQKSRPSCPDWQIASWHRPQPAPAQGVAGPWQLPF